MTIYDALHSLIGFPHLMAFRMPGPQITLSRYLMVIDHQGPKPRRYVPSFNDLVSVDWQVMKKEDFAKLLQNMYNEAMEQRAALQEQQSDNPLEGQE